MITFFNNLVKGLHLSDNCEKKCLIAYIFPCKLCNFLIFEGGGIFVIDLILLGSTLVPCQDIINPNNFPEVTLKTYFFGFNRILSSRSQSNIIINTFGCCSLVLDLANRSSI